MSLFFAFLLGWSSLWSTASTKLHDVIKTKMINNESSSRVDVSKYILKQEKQIVSMC